MIEKLDVIRDSENCVDAFGETYNVAGKGVIPKINEIIDYLESIRNIINVHEREIDQLQMSASVDNIITKYEDERKWIGKLCKFRDDKEFSWQYGILTDIVVGTDYPYWMGNIEFAECQPVLEEEFKDVIYKKA